MNLYIVTTEGLGDFYVVSESFDNAASRLKTELDKFDYGYSNDRKIISVRLFKTENTDNSGRRYFFDEIEHLIV